MELTNQPWEHRWKALAESLQSELNINFEAEIKDVTAESLGDAVREVVNSKADVCRISDNFNSFALPELVQTTQEALTAGVCPLLIREKGQWWPRPLMEEAFKTCLTENFAQLDIASNALIAGSGPAGRQVIAAISKIGYSVINITDQDIQSSQKLVDAMKKRFFQIKFKVIPFQEITTLPGVHSLVVNTTPLILENELLDELYFFNFLKSQGAVVDLTLVPSHTPLMLEAEQWGARHLSGDFVAADCDVYMIEKLTGKKISKSKYREALRKNVDAAPFDAGPFLNRFRERGS